MLTDSKNRCVGILSTSDLIDPTREFKDERNDAEGVHERAREWMIEKLTEEHFGQRKVSECMTCSVVAVDRETSILDATAEMLRHRIHHLPIVDQHQKVLGIVSTMDMLTVFHRCQSE